MPRVCAARQDHLRHERRKLLDLASSVRRQLRDARFSELEEIVLGGEGTSPIEAAKKVKAGVGREDWVPGPLLPGISSPLTEGEVRQLYASQGTLTRADESQLPVPQPVLARLVTPADFRLLAAE